MQLKAAIKTENQDSANQPIAETGLPQNMPQTPPKTKKINKIFIAVILLLLMFTLGGGIAAIQARGVYSKARETMVAARGVYDSLKNQDLVTAGTKVDELKGKLNQTRDSFAAMRWTGWLPFLGSYWHDGEHALEAGVSAVEATDILIAAVEPYADVLGFTGQGSFLGGTAEDRIVKIVETLNKVTPQLDAVAEKLKTVDSELSQIKAKRYPFTFEGKKVEDQILLAQQFAQDAYFAVTKAKPAIEKLPKIMGVDGERKYMVLFQNDAELRATGGFLTAFAILRVEKGKVFQEKSEDIYALDARFNSTIPAPEIIRKYLPLVYRFNLRDSNLSPDFKLSMDTFSGYYNQIKGEPKIDGIIAVDTQVLNDIIQAIGPIEVPGYGTYSTETDPRCNCPQVVYALEELADRPTASLRENRKAILAPMLQAILTKSYGSPKQVWPSLFSAIQKNFSQKHVLLYFLDPEEQSAAELINLAGRISEYEGDYFHLNNTNFAGAKSNMFTTSEVEQVYELGEDGLLIKTVTLKYQNPFPPSNCNLEAGELCLNGGLRDFVRVYVPKGSQLLEALGSEVEVETKEDLDKTVFEAFFTLQPQSQAKLVFRYKLPFGSADLHSLLIQKQPGAKASQYKLTTPAETLEFELLSDKELELRF